MYSEDDRAVQKTKKVDNEDLGKIDAGGKVGNKIINGNLVVQFNEKNLQSEEVKEEFRYSKTNFLLRHIMQYQEIFKKISEISGGDSYLFLDDLYHIRRADQAKVIDYFHRIAKGNGLWLKIGTIRNRTTWYLHGDPPIGVKIGDDVDEIDLDLTLEKYSLAKDFLVKVIREFLGELKMVTLLTDGAIDRLILASGGVARDFLGIFRRSILVARERKGTNRVQKIGVEDVNAAAGEYDTLKSEELKRDTLDDQQELEDEFKKIRNFCTRKLRSNVFLLNKDFDNEIVENIHELVDLRLLHKVKSRVTIADRPGNIFEAYMLDVSQYAASRKMRDLKIIEFWRPAGQEELRRVSLVYDPTKDEADELKNKLNSRKKPKGLMTAKDKLISSIAASHSNEDRSLNRNKVDEDGQLDLFSPNDK